MATENSMKKIPLVSARAGVQDDSSVDYMVNDPGQALTMRTRNATVRKDSTEQGPMLQRCRCGWAKVTSLNGLRIHQGRKKCLKPDVQGTRIDQYFLGASQVSRVQHVQQQEEPHSLQNINPPPIRVTEQLNTEGNVEAYTPHSATENKIQGQRPLVKWPKSHEQRVAER